MSRSAMRLRPNALSNPRARPVIWQRLRMRVLDELRGSRCSANCAAVFSSSDALGFWITAFSAFRLAA